MDEKEVHVILKIINNLKKRCQRKTIRSDVQKILNTLRYPCSVFLRTSLSAFAHRFLKCGVFNIGNKKIVVESCSESKSPSRMRGRGWLSGLGIRSSFGPSLQMTSAPHQSPRRASTVADDIQNDHNLFFLDDEILPRTSPRMITTVGLRGSSSLTNTGLSRYSSLKKMELLQQEVDRE